MNDSSVRTRRHRPLLILALALIGAVILSTGTGVVRESCVDLNASARTHSSVIDSHWNYVAWPPLFFSSIDPDGVCIRNSPLRMGLDALGVWSLPSAADQVNSHIFSEGLGDDTFSHGGKVSIGKSFVPPHPSRLSRQAPTSMQHAGSIEVYPEHIQKGQIFRLSAGRPLPQGQLDEVTLLEGRAHGEYRPIYVLLGATPPRLMPAGMAAPKPRSIPYRKFLNSHESVAPEGGTEQHLKMPNVPGGFYRLVNWQKGPLRSFKGPQIGVDVHGPVRRPKR